MLAADDDDDWLIGDNDVDSGALSSPMAGGVESSGDDSIGHRSGDAVGRRSGDAFGELGADSSPSRSDVSADASPDGGDAHDIVAAVGASRSSANGVSRGSSVKASRKTGGRRPFSQRKSKNAPQTPERPNADTHLPYGEKNATKADSAAHSPIAGGDEDNEWFIGDDSASEPTSLSVGQAESTTPHSPIAPDGARCFSPDAHTHKTEKAKQHNTRTTAHTNTAIADIPNQSEAARLEGSDAQHPNSSDAERSDTALAPVEALPLPPELPPNAPSEQQRENDDAPYPDSGPAQQRNSAIAPPPNSADSDSPTHSIPHRITAANEQPTQKDEAPHPISAMQTMGNNASPQFPNGPSPASPNAPTGQNDGSNTWGDNSSEYNPWADYPDVEPIIPQALEIPEQPQQSDVAPTDGGTVQNAWADYYENQTDWQPNSDNTPNGRGVYGGSSNRSVWGDDARESSPSVQAEEKPAQVFEPVPYRQSSEGGRTFDMGSMFDEFNSAQPQTNPPSPKTPVRRTLLIIGASILALILLAGGGVAAKTLYDHHLERQQVEAAEQAERAKQDKLNSSLSDYDAQSTKAWKLIGTVGKSLVSNDPTVTEKTNALKNLLGEKPDRTNREKMTDATDKLASAYDDANKAYANAMNGIVQNTNDRLNDLLKRAVAAGDAPDGADKTAMQDKAKALTGKSATIDNVADLKTSVDELDKLVTKCETMKRDEEAKRKVEAQAEEDRKRQEAEAQAQAQQQAQQPSYTPSYVPSYTPAPTYTPPSTGNSGEGGGSTLVPDTGGGGSTDSNM